MGSSWATLISYLTLATICYLLGQKYYPIPYNVGKSMAYIVLTTGLAYAVSYITIENQLAATGFHTVILIAYLFIIYLIERKELQLSTN
jgi:hypothetical protein